jgi:hypothetical protein
MNPNQSGLSELKAEAAQQSQPALIALGRVAIQLRLTSDDVETLLPSLLGELTRNPNDFWSSAVLRAALPILVERFRRSFARYPGVTYADAEDLSHNTVVKVLTAFMKGRHPRGNVGAWLARIQERVFLDYQRQSARRRRGFERLEMALRKLRRQ